MIVHEFELYRLLLSFNPCEVFDYFEVNEMHGLNVKDCEDYDNTTEDAYIAGWCNYSPTDGKPYVFINLSRCTNDMRSTGLIMHELIHLVCRLFDDWEENEEFMITWAEMETYNVMKLIE